MRSGKSHPACYRQDCRGGALALSQTLTGIGAPSPAAGDDGKWHQYHCFKELHGDFFKKRIVTISNINLEVLDT